MSDITNFDIRTCVTDSLIAAFDSMFSVGLESTDSIPAESLEKTRNIVSVSFAGDANGMVSVQIGNKFFRQLAAELSGTEVGGFEDDDKIQSLIGELGNLMASDLKSSLSDAGLACTISTPSLAIGADSKTEPLGMAESDRVALRSEDNLILVEMAVNISERSDSRVAPSDEPSAQKSTRNVSSGTASKFLEEFDLELLLDIPLEIKVELGRARIQIQELLNLAPGSAVKLVKLEGEPVDIMANDTLIARGEVVVQREKYGIRVTEITSRIDRIRSFNI